MADRADLQIYQGTDWSATVGVKNADGTPANLAGCSAKAQVRPDYADLSSTVIADISASITGSNIVLTLTKYQTAVFKDKYVWDLDLTDTFGTVTALLYGKVVTTLGVTR